MAEIAAAELEVAGGYIVAHGTITTDKQAWSSTATWNNAGVTFTHIKANITNTASAATSKLIDLQVGGVTQFNVTRGGAVTATGAVTAGTTNSTHIFTGGDNGSGTTAFQVRSASGAGILTIRGDGSWVSAQGGTITAGGLNVTGSCVLTGAVSGITTLASGKHTITDATFSHSRRSSPSLQVANDGTATISTTAFSGIAFIVCRDNGRTAIASFNGGNGFGTLLLNDSSLYSSTAGTASKVNIYESGGNFILQNKSGGTLNFRIDHFGS